MTTHKNYLKTYSKPPTVLPKTALGNLESVKPFSSRYIFQLDLSGSDGSGLDAVDVLEFLASVLSSPSTSTYDTSSSCLKFDVDIAVKSFFDPFLLLRGIFSYVGPSFFEDLPIFLKSLNVLLAFVNLGEPLVFLLTVE